MYEKIVAEINFLKNNGRKIHDEEEMLRYLKKVGYHRLSMYFQSSGGDSKVLISQYLFDKQLRLLILEIVEVVENALKSIVCNHLSWGKGTLRRYLDQNMYKENFRVERIKFIIAKHKEIEVNDITAKNFLKKQIGEIMLPDYIFFDKLTFGELEKTYKDLLLDYQKQISAYFGVNVFVFGNRISAIKYVRNLCSHYEHIFNRTMVYSIKGYDIQDSLGNNNTCIAYILLLSLFQKILIPEYNRSKKIWTLTNTYKISLQHLGLQKNLPSKHTSFDVEAWEVLVSKIYTKNIKNAK